MRQAGILAAAGLHALDHHVERLADDHRRAGRLARAAAEVAPGLVDPDQVETNIVVLETEAAAELVRRCREQDVLVSLLDHRHARLVTHLDVDDEQVDRAAKVLREVVRG
jgi:threonine aldolase